MSAEFCNEANETVCTLAIGDTPDLSLTTQIYFAKLDGRELMFGVRKLGQRGVRPRASNYTYLDAYARAIFANW